jgi:hypothetical protein
MGPGEAAAGDWGLVNRTPRIWKVRARGHGRLDGETLNAANPSQFAGTPQASDWGPHQMPVGIILQSRKNFVLRLNQLAQRPAIDTPFG